MALLRLSKSKSFILHLSVLFFMTFWIMPGNGAMNWNSEYELKRYQTSVEAARDFHIKYCGRVCNGTTIVQVGSQSCKNPECLKCYCDPMCSLYDVCCPSLDLISEVATFQTEAKETSSNRIPAANRFQCDHFPGMTKSHFFMIKDCPEDYVHQKDGIAKAKKREIQQMCESSTISSMHELTPYSDLDNGITYRNKFCAICNDYNIDDEKNDTNSNAGPWTIDIKCSHFQNLYHLISEIDFFHAAIKEGCEVEFKFPNSTYHPKECDPNMQENDTTLSSCTNPDPVLNFLCRNLTENYFKVSDGNNTNARNLFCYMCNGGRPFSEACVAESKKPFVVTPMSLLLGVKHPGPVYDSGSIVNEDCENASHWRDEDGECQPALCSKGKSWYVDGKCSSVLTQVRGLGYTMSVILLPTTNTAVSALDIREISESINTRISAVSEESEVRINITVLYNPNKTRCFDLLHQISISSYIVGDEKQGRDKVENELLNITENNWKFVLAGGRTENLTLKPLVFGSEGCDWHQNNERMVISENVFEEINKDPLYPRPVPSVLSCYQLTSSTTDYFDFDCLTGTKLYTHVYRPRQIHKDMWSIKDKFIDVTASLLCPYVVVNTSDILLEGDDILATFTYQNVNINVTLSSDVSVVNGKLRICLDIFKNLTAHLLKEKSGQYSLTLAQYYFEIACVSVSITCLLITFFTYCLFPTLRSLPGLNNMTLSISLALAQICLLISVQYGFQGLLVPIYCTIHAMFTHYFWLSAFAWMSVCCLHMYRVFTRHTSKSTSPRSTTKRHLYYCAYAFGCPLVIVAATVCFNLGISKGESHGYDDTICFLDTRKSVLGIIIIFLVPLALVVISNGVFFILTIREIVQVNRLNVQSHNHERQGVITYAKLSTLTGVFCAVTIIAVRLQNPVLNFFVSPFITLQGLFIFLSFIVNRRVGKLYLELLNCHRQTVYSFKTHDSDQKKSGNSNTLSTRTQSTDI